ncbi:hypothetical protein [Phenylobacterium sp.]|uniref:hypothetical protein n=1 Tax=Phenylobacterium sp. TaxID=1871053 RepID=UPI0035B23302
MLNPKLAGAIAGLLALLAAGFGAKIFLDRAGRDHVQARAYGECQAAAAQKAGAKAPEAACAKPIAEALVDAFRARACDFGLRADPDPTRPGRWITPAACGAKVQTLAASNNAALDAVDARDSEIHGLRASQAAAIARAEARGALLARRKAHVQAAIAAAPRDAAGLIVCRGVCLRTLAGLDEAEDRPAPAGADRPGPH